jgi:hypothetical protein
VSLANAGDGSGRRAYFWSVSGVLLDIHFFTLPPRQTHVLNTASVPGAAGKSGMITVANDARYGELSGKTVALDVSTGFSFDSPMLPRPR